MADQQNEIAYLLDERLIKVGLRNNEIDLFIKDVLRTTDVFPEFNLEEINLRLKLLGWGNICADYATIQLVKACHECNMSSNMGHFQ